MLVSNDDEYVQLLVLRALQRRLGGLPYELIETISQLPEPQAPILQFSSYEHFDFEHAMQYPRTSLLSAYVIRKALIRKHYLSNTVSTWLTKHPESNLSMHVKPSVHFELDFVEFLDDALVDAWDLNESMQHNEEASVKEWWILKPAMSDGAQGIRLFSSLEQLQAIFEEWEVEESDDEVNDEEIRKRNESLVDSKPTSDNGRNAQLDGSGILTSQLRHFIAQPYIDPPLLLPSKSKRKFHIRTYVLAVGALKVYVYKEMLALFAARPYRPLQDDNESETNDLVAHLTNTCIQDENDKTDAAHRFWSIEDELNGSKEWKEAVYKQICDITGEILEAAAREQMVNFQAIPNAFEIFGVDFMVDADLNVWLLEFNAFPDFKQTGEDLKEKIVGKLFENVMDLAVVPFFTNHQPGELSDMPLVRNIDIGRGR